ncbi:LCP family protein [Enterococcus ureasiticus]|uniref:Cell envelope-related transcriptional attenuator domain-containing protein n=1 Tax=Enterococcus ureasiticus TaxID=903984 RepID=A0A1E5GH33_9ENTE|nr:LCP family protein [Enterococcus ureasiticus]OEG11957.1 hypothetical protein BCR21_06895 [Enterococcus ureasiticus]
MKKKNKPERKKRKGWLTFLWGFLFLLLVIVIVAAACIGKIYWDVKKTSNAIHNDVPIEMRGASSFDHKKDDIVTGKPFSVLIMGIDTGDFGRTDIGRSDTMMVATVNQKKKETLLMSVPRDTYTEISGKGFPDKINHAYAFGGAAMAMDTTENLLNIPIHYYIWLNMKGMSDLVDVLGGITVMNPTAFTYAKFDYPVGELKMGGLEALQYTRMRKEDPRGDYGRQERQRIVLEAISKKLLNLSNVTKYQSILNVLGENMQTNLTLEEMRDIEQNYHSALVNIRGDYMQGEGAMIDGGSYQLIPEAELSRVQKELAKSLQQ